MKHRYNLLCAAILATRGRLSPRPRLCALPTRAITLDGPAFAQ